MAFFGVGNFPDTALFLECVQRGGYLTSSKHLDGRFQRRILLADDLVKVGRTHSSFLQLLKRSAGVHALMLARITDQQNTVPRSEAGEKLAHLVGAGKARFVDKVEVLLIRRHRGGQSGEKSLQRSSLNPGLTQLACGARGWSKTLDLISLAFSSAADDGECRGLARTRKTLDALYAVWQTQDILNNGLLGAVEMRVLVSN
jgi:hypothetical protein